MTLRARRLASDAETIRSNFGPDSRIRLIDAEGDPPERYRFEYQVQSLVVQNGTVVPSPRQIVEVYLTLSYPRQAPQCRMLTPCFHPNIAPHAICIGDHWSAGESLAALLVRIAEMLTYQSYNLQSPLNGDAAKWADQHMAELPLEEFDFGSLLASGPLLSAPRMPPLPVMVVAPAAPREPSEDPGGLPAPAPPIGTRPHTAECPHCGASLSLPENAAPGAWMRCPLCGRMLQP